LIRRLEEIHQDLPMEAMRQSRELGELIEELIAEKPKPERGFIIERSDGIQRAFYTDTGFWSVHLQEAHLFKLHLDEDMGEILSRIVKNFKPDANYFSSPTVRHCQDATFFTSHVVRDRKGKIRRLP
jgi:hypothetical protein